MKAFAITLLILALTACTRRTFVAEYGEREAPREVDAVIEVYSLSMPTRPFRELGEIEVRSNSAKAMKKIKMMARRLGADAVIITGSAGTRGKAYAVTNDFAVGERHEYGKRAVAIVYTDKSQLRAATLQEGSEPTAVIEPAPGGGTLGRPSSPTGVPLE